MANQNYPKKIAQTPQLIMSYDVIKAKVRFTEVVSPHRSTVYTV